jgi:gluconolactonase
MRAPLGTFLTVVLLACGASAPEFLVETPEFSEGPVFDADGNLYFTHGKSVSKLTPEGDLLPWLETQGANGHKILPDGTHLICEPAASRILRVSAAGQVLGVASDASDGQPLRAPNDLTLSPEGGFYFTDPGGSREAPIGTVHYVTPEGATRTVATGLSVPNGLALNPDKSVLYVAETVPNRVLAFPVEAPGKLGPMRVFADLPKAEGPDGLAVDAAGNVYVAHLGVSVVQVISPSGAWLRSLPAGNYDVSNLTFSASGDELYVTGSVGSRRDTPGRVYRLKVSQ